MTDELFDDLAQLLGDEPRSSVVLLFSGSVGQDSVTRLGEALAEYGPVVLRDDTSGLEAIPRWGWRGYPPKAAA